MKKPFCVTIDDATLLKFSSIIGMEKLLNLLGEYNVPATFFVAAKANEVELSYKRDWVDVLRKAREKGHELQLHGLEHTGLEFGYPPDFILAYEDELRERIKKERDEIESEMTKEKLDKKLKEAIEIFQDVFGIRPVGFRAPYASTHENTFKVLLENGFIYDSSYIVNPKGWYFVRKEYNSKIDWISGRKPEPYVIKANKQKLYEMPIMSEYTWYLEKQYAKLHYEMMLSDLEKTLTYEKGMFISVAHVDPASQDTNYMDDDTGLVLYRRIFEWVRKNNKYEFCTLSEALKR